MNFTSQQKQTSTCFLELRNKICAEFELIEQEFSGNNDAKFQKKPWQIFDETTKKNGGYGEMSVMKGKVFEKVGVNFSEVFGKFSDKFKHEIPGAEADPTFWASGISLVAHMSSPLVPAVHLNTRFICTTKSWFGGGADLNPALPNEQDTLDFHQTMQQACNKTDINYYDKFKKWCDEYFFIKHRNVARGVGGIFYDYLNTNNFENDFTFTKNVGLAFLDIFPKIVRRNMHLAYNETQKHQQLCYRGLYAEFNLIYDRGTRFGLLTNGNPEAILMSLPPMAVWQ